MRYRIYEESIFKVDVWSLGRMVWILDIGSVYWVCDFRVRYDIEIWGELGF